MAFFFKSKYILDFNNPNLNYFEAIKKYNKLCDIENFTFKNDAGKLIYHEDLRVGTKSNTITIGENLAQLTHHPEFPMNSIIEISTVSADSETAVGIWPELPVTATTLPENFKENYQQIKTYIESIIDQCSSNFEYDVFIDYPPLNNTENPPTPEQVMHAINIAFPVTGAIHLSNNKAIIFEIKQQQFVLDYRHSPICIYQTRLCLDLDYGFSGNNENFTKTLNEQYFIPFKKNNYKGDLVSGDKNGFTPSNPENLVSVRLLKKEMADFEKRVQQMETLAKSDFDYSASAKTGRTLLTKLNQYREQLKQDKDFNKYKRACYQSMHDAKPVLEQWKTIFPPLYLDNLLTVIVACATLGISLAITHQYTGQYALGLFARETEELKSLNTLPNAFEPTAEEMKEYFNFSFN